MVTKPKVRKNNTWLYQIFLFIDFVSLFVYFWRNINQTLQLSTLAIVMGYVFLIGVGLGLIYLIKSESSQGSPALIENEDEPARVPNGS